MTRKRTWSEISLTIEWALTHRNNNNIQLYRTQDGGEIWSPMLKTQEYGRNKDRRILWREQISVPTASDRWQRYKREPLPSPTCAEEALG